MEKLIREHRAIKSVIKIHSDNYYSQDKHLDPSLNFFISNHLGFYWTSKEITFHYHRETLIRGFYVSFIIIHH